MGEYLGLFIDDDERNFTSIERLLALKEIDLLPYDNLPENIDEIYQRILDEKVDFVIIDFDLGKQPVRYTGIDVLKSIRAQDSEIYIIYLTNKEFVQDHIGDFDQTIRKKEFANEIDNVVSRLVRALSRDLSLKYERELELNYSLQAEYLDKRIELLKEKLGK